jgi:hypothetical protein
MRREGGARRRSSSSRSSRSCNDRWGKELLGRKDGLCLGASLTDAGSASLGAARSSSSVSCLQLCHVYHSS